MNRRMFLALAALVGFKATPALAATPSKPRLLWYFAESSSGGLVALESVATTNQDGDFNGLPGSLCRFVRFGEVRKHNPDFNEKMKDNNFGLTDDMMLPVIRRTIKMNVSTQSNTRAEHFFFV
jgi:hypothetical protein